MPNHLSGSAPATTVRKTIAPEPTSLEQLYPDELSRWVLFLGVPMMAASLFVVLALATPFAWLFAGAIVFGPGLGIAAVVYLSMSSDTNGSSASAIADEARAHQRVEAQPATVAA